MKKSGCIVLIIWIFLLAPSFAGCIERHTEKTETAITKFDSAAGVQWTTVIENTDYSSAQSSTIANRIIRTSDNGYLIAGRFSDPASGDNLRLIKLDSAGIPVWEKRAGIGTGDLEFLAIVQRSDNGYSIITRHGHVYCIDATGTLGETREISGQINEITVHTTAGEEYPPVTVHSAARTPEGEIVLFADNYADIYQPMVIVGLSPDGTVLWKKTPDQTLIRGTTILIETSDGGFLLGKSRYISLPDMTKIVIDKTDGNTSLVWDSTIGLCNYAYCNNVLLGMHESGDHEYEIVYLSSEVNGSVSDPDHGMIVMERLDSSGQVIRQDIVTITELPAWLFDQATGSPDLIGQINRGAMNSVLAPDGQENPITRIDSLIKTGDDGYAIVTSRYYF